MEEIEKLKARIGSLEYAFIKVVSALVVVQPGFTVDSVNDIMSEYCNDSDDE